MPDIPIETQVINPITLTGGGMAPIGYSGSGTVEPPAAGMGVGNILNTRVDWQVLKTDQTPVIGENGTATVLPNLTWTFSRQAQNLNSNTTYLLKVTVNWRLDIAVRESRGFTTP
jgi:phosphodiesterase/alkaline phosphatase D-like protein